MLLTFSSVAFKGCWVSYGIKQEPVGGPSADDRMGRRPHADLAQLVEQCICNAPVGGPIPSVSAKIFGDPPPMASKTKMDDKPKASYIGCSL